MATIANPGPPVPGDIPLHAPNTTGPFGELDAGSPYTGQRQLPYAQSSPSYPPLQGIGAGWWNALTREERFVPIESRRHMGSPPKVDYPVATPFDYAYPSTYPGAIVAPAGFSLSDPTPGGLFGA